MNVGLDVGSTTIKAVALDEKGNVIYKSYERHYSHIKQSIIDILKKISGGINQRDKVNLAISGSAGMGVANECAVPFVQEVYATRIAAKRYEPDTDVIIELGGEDAKILFLSGAIEVRMNGSCAGGTGAFIDQMATLLNVQIEDMDALAKKYEKVYTIASRCGVFAKSDIQPLLNQGAKKSDISKSIFMAVVNQTIAGLAQGRKIDGKVLYLGGPLTFMEELRKSFDDVLGVKGICPENSLYYVALGSALSAYKEVSISRLIENIENYKNDHDVFNSSKALFASKEEYEDFSNRHNRNVVKKGNIHNYKGDVYLGIDAGSTTIKFVLMGESEELLLSRYIQNDGTTVDLVRKFLLEIYDKFPNIKIKASAVTGYGEELIKNAFKIDFGIVETVAHLTSAKKFMPDVEFIIDIGGQDIKCFKVHNGIIDNIFLNEACSSGCGSFLQTFANALGYEISDFAKLGLFAKKPVDLGSRCTVFMNSAVKQAQKDGATIEDISAGLSISVVKNAIYKVIRATSAEALGRKIVVQGGTFLNDAVLRAFELEMKAEIVRPDVAGLMGAYGAAIFAKKSSLKEGSSILKKEDLLNLTHDVKNVRCSGCSNNCQLTINTFFGGNRYISGNRCEKPITNKKSDNSLNMYEYKLNLLKQYGDFAGGRATVGIPLVLNMFELLPFWHTFFRSLNFSIKISPISSREMYIDGQCTIPSDTVCFPAKLVHGHIESLIKSKVDFIFYPCMSYNFDENLGDNHYNCPVVAYYPEVIHANVEKLKNTPLINDYIGLHREKEFPKKMYLILQKYIDNVSYPDVEKAAQRAYDEYKKHLEKIRQKGKSIIDQATRQNKRIIILAGRPYHIDPEINHGIDKLILTFDVAIISEDAVPKMAKEKLHVLNQWSYHSRLYNAAKYIKDKKNINLVQLVSFGCGIDAITTDEMRDILEREGKIYTQLKIDEITNLGAIKIRLRSLFAALAQGNIT
ncbi:MAG: 2-hydroxyacyl-CoA dehydratase [Clostridia bacterium]|nr:2-hydroxyacyl-CoA dehydratase [Clostridia bacterium]